MKSKSPTDLARIILGCRRFNSSFRTTQRPTRTWITYFDSTQTLQSLIWFVLGKHAQTVYHNHPSFSKSDSRQRLTTLLRWKNVDNQWHNGLRHPPAFYRNLQPQGHLKRPHLMHILKVRKFTLKHTSINCLLFPSDGCAGHSTEIPSRYI